MSHWTLNWWVLEEDQFQGRSSLILKELHLRYFWKHKMEILRIGYGILTYLQMKWWYLGFALKYSSQKEEEGGVRGIYETNWQLISCWNWIVSFGDPLNYSLSFDMWLKFSKKKKCFQEYSFIYKSGAKRKGPDWDINLDDTYLKVVFEAMDIDKTSQAERREG